MKKIIKDLKEMFLYFVPVLSTILVKILEPYSDIWYYLICVCVFVAQTMLYVISKRQHNSVLKQKENFDKAFKAQYDENGDVTSTTINGGIIS